ncbi:MAG: sulfatase [Candidatus Bathyarchaeota archaeon]|nr:MAG: sulfatase [Candidatus Bathyarchaeota archaeon]
MKSVILLTIECLRADHMHFMGYHKRTTPNLDTFAKEGIVYTNTMSTSPWTPGSFFSIFTSLYPLMRGGTISPTDQTITLAECLRIEGYKTAAFAPGGWLSPLLGWGRGFEVYESSVREKSEKKRVKKSLPQKTIAQRFKIHELFSQFDRILNVSTKDLIFQYRNYRAPKQQTREQLKNQKALFWLNKNLNENKFLWIHYLQPHEPYYPTREYVSFSQIFKICKLNYKAMRNQAKREIGDVKLSNKELNELIALYDQQIITVDGLIGELITKIRSLEGETYFIITGDHGQGFMEHGILGHGLELYNEIIHTPLIILGPHITHKKIESVVSLRNIPLTVFSLLNIKPYRFSGISLLNKQQVEEQAKYGIISEASRNIRNQVSMKGGVVNYTNPQAKKWAITTNKWKFIFRKKGKMELYNRERDPKETIDVSKVQKNIARTFENKIKAHINFEDNASTPVRSKLRWKIMQLKRRKNTKLKL